MKKPVLVIMAAGMGSRYGGLKQIDPVGPHGEIILDYSLYDAKLAGFEKVIFIIKHQIEKDFMERVGRRVERHMEVEYVFQEQNVMLPEGFVIPEGRVKPWGTGHAILCCKDLIDAPFAVINADDYYGRSAFRVLYDRLLRAEDRDGVADFSMVGFEMANTMTENGSVARGVCDTDENGRLVNINERTRVEWHEGKPAYTEDDGKTWTYVAPDNLVSMNMWGLTPSVFTVLEKEFPVFLEKTVPANPMKAEFYIPVEVGRLLREGGCTVEVLSSPDRWYGVTYQADKPMVAEAMQSLVKAGVYPDERLLG